MKKITQLEEEAEVSTEVLLQKVAKVKVAEEEEEVVKTWL